jgi:excisionase family DNA binding protein
MDSTPQLPRLLTAQTLAEHLDLPLWRVYELAREGQIPHLRIGRSLRFDPVAVSGWIRQGGTGVGEAGP